MEDGQPVLKMHDGIAWTTTSDNSTMAHRNTPKMDGVVWSMQLQSEKKAMRLDLLRSELGGSRRGGGSLGAVAVCNSLRLTRSHV